MALPAISSTIPRASKRVCALTGRCIGGSWGGRALRNSAIFLKPSTARLWTGRRAGKGVLCWLVSMHGYGVGGLFSSPSSLLSLSLSLSLSLYWRSRSPGLVDARRMCSTHGYHPVYLPRYRVNTWSLCPARGCTADQARRAHRHLPALVPIALCAWSLERIHMTRIDRTRAPGTFEPLDTWRTAVTRLIES